MQNSDSGQKTGQARSLNPGDEGPWGWFTKFALRRIREALDDVSFLDQALALYTAHCEAASDAQSTTYTITRRELAKRSGVSLRRVTEINERLRSISLLSWVQNFIPGSKELGPSTFTLMSCTGSTTLSTTSTTSSTPHPRSGTNAKQQICTVQKESLKESPEKAFKNLSEPLPSANGAGTTPAGSQPVKVQSIQSNELEKAKRATRQWKRAGELMARVRELLTEPEMKNDGGKWRNRCNSNPSKVERCIAELERMVKESEPISTRAGCLEDLWKRFA